MLGEIFIYDRRQHIRVRILDGMLLPIPGHQRVEFLGKVQRLLDRLLAKANLFQFLNINLLLDLRPLRDQLEDFLILQLLQFHLEGRERFQLHNLPGDVINRLQLQPFNFTPPFYLGKRLNKAVRIVPRLTVHKNANTDVRQT